MYSEITTLQMTQKMCVKTSKTKNRFYSDQFRITIEPVIIERYVKTLVNRGFCKINRCPIMATNTTLNTGCISVAFSVLGFISATTEVYATHRQIEIWFIYEFIISSVILVADSTILGQNSVNRFFSNAVAIPSSVLISHFNNSLHI